MPGVTDGGTPYALGTDQLREVWPDTSLQVAQRVDAIAELLDGVRIRYGFSRADNAGLLTLTFPAGEWSGQPVVIGQATEITGSQVILKGGGTATSVTLAVQNNSGQPVPLCYLSWIAVGVPGE